MKGTYVHIIETRLRKYYEIDLLNRNLPEDLKNLFDQSDTKQSRDL